MKKFILAGMVALMSQAASAQLRTVSGRFVASNWQILFSPASAPIKKTYVNFSVTYDPSVSYFNDQTSFNYIHTNVPYPVFFTYDAGEGISSLATNGSSSGCSISPFSFCAFFGNPLSALPDAAYQSTGVGAWRASSVVSVPGVPEPSSWAMLIAGFGLVGAAARRRRTVRA